MKHPSIVEASAKASLGLLIPLFFLLSALPSGAQNLIYAKGLKNPIPVGGDVISKSIKADVMGNSYVTGSFMGTADFDPGPGEVNLTSAGNADIFIAKYDASGNYVYAKTMGGPGNDMGNGIGIGPAGNVYITGTFSETADFDPGAGVAGLTSNQESEDIFIAGYDASGNYMYAKAIGSEFTDGAYGIAVDNSGGVYITGYFTGTADFDPGPGVANLTSTGGADIYVARYDASGSYVYAISMGGSDSDFGNGIAIDGLGNAYITGYFIGTVDFNPAGEVADLRSAGFLDVFIAKYDAAGNYVYAKAMGGALGDAGNGIAVDGSGNAYVTGYFNSTADFDPGAGVATLTSAGDYDIFIAKYNASGNYVYAKSMGGTGSEQGFGIALYGLGNVYVTGDFTGTADFNPGVGMDMLTSAGENDIFVANYDVLGGYIYAEAMGGPGGDVGNGIDIDGAGNTYITGSFFGTADFDPNDGVSTLTIGGTAGNGFTLRLSNIGEYVWAGQLGKYPYALYYEQGRSIAVDALGNTYITGNFSGTVDFDPGPGTANLTSVGIADIFVARYDASGNYVFAKAIGSAAESDAGNGIAIDGSGNVYVTGYFSGTADFDPGAGVANLTSAGSADIFVVRLNGAGNFVYAKALGGTGYDNGNSIAVDASGNVYVTGLFVGVADLDPGAGVSLFTSAGFDDIFVAKLNASGNYVYAKTMGGTSLDNGNGIAVDGSGNVYITGYFVGDADFNQGLGTAVLTSAGDFDAYIARYDASGNFVYAKAIGGPGADYGYGIAVDGAGNVVVSGTFADSADFDPGAGVQNLLSGGLSSVFFARYNASGNFVYAKAMGGNTTSDQGNGYDVAADASGNVYVAGYFAGTADFDPGAGTANLTSAGSYDIFIAKYNASGNYVYAKAMGGNAQDGCYGIAVDGSGNAHITGYFGETADFDRVGAGAILTASNAEDAFIAAYGSSGTVPVNLVSFTARPVSSGKAVQLNWTTASQTNNAYFEVERSHDGVHFETIGRRQGCSTCTTLQQYALYDNNPYSGLSYYRLKQVDHDTHFSYSDQVPISITTGAGTTVQVYPTVTTGSYEVVIKNNPSPKTVVIDILNAAGTRIKQQTERLQEGENRFRYSLSDQARGVYYITVSGKGKDAVSTFKIIKN